MRVAVSAVLLLCFLYAAAFAQDQPAGSDPAGGDPAAMPDSDALAVLPVAAVTFLPVALNFPADYDPQRSYPLLIGLHGFGANAERFLSNFYAFREPQFIYAVPQAPYLAPQPEWIGFSWILFGTGDVKLEAQTMLNSIDYLSAVEDEVRQHYNVSETYLLGFSQGGTLAYRAALASPGRYAGLACIAAPLDEFFATPEALAALTDLRLFIAHGTEDDALPLRYSIAARDTFLANGNAVEYYEYPGQHSFDAAVLQRIEDWILGRESAQ